MMPAAQTTRSALKNVAGGVCTPPASTAVTRCPVCTATSSRCSSSVAAARKPLRQRRQDARRGLEQREADVAHRVEVLESIAGMRARGLPDLGRELDAGGTGADDDDVDLRRLTGRRARIRTHTGRQQAPMEALGVDRACRARSRTRATPGTPKSLLTLPMQTISVS